ncbi:MAG: SpoIIE family protein phosphatase [Candidatus Eremiobacteraeota bacterium]|nr:SpoIIE family protein phosphatase [Candidatus Eremiobacteraeota bacterium]
MVTGREVHIPSEVADLAAIAALLRAQDAELRAVAMRVYAARGLPSAYGDRAGVILDGVVSAFAGHADDFYSCGAELGQGTARWLRGRGDRLPDVVDRLHRARVDLFLMELPERLPPQLRTLAIRHIAWFLTGYIGRLYSGDTALDYEFAGLTVRRLSTTRSIPEIERVAVDAARRLLAVDAAWFARRDDGVWSMSTQRGLDAGTVALTLRDEDIPGVAALLSGETIAYDRVQRASPDENAIARALGVRVALVVPIIVEGTCTGMLGAGRIAETRFTAQDRGLAEILGAQVGARLRELHAATRMREALGALEESDRLLREQLRRKEQIVETLQQIYIPRAFPTVPGISFDAVYVPAEDDARVGGDWYDVFQLPDGRLAFSVGDVAGHGLHAAVTMGAIRQAIYVASLDSPDPAAVLRAVNRVLLLQQAGMATAIVGFLDPRTRQITYALAGHPPPLVAGPGGARFLEPGGIPLGILDDPLVTQARLDASGETMFVLYTDGLIEYARDVAAGEEALRRAVEVAASEDPTRDHALRIVERVLGSGGTDDDLALLVVRFAEPGARFAISSTQRRSDAISWDVDASDPSSAAAVRTQFVAFLCRFVDAQTDLFPAELILGELLANAVEHAPGAVHVELAWRGDEPFLTVRDNGRGFQPRARLPEDVFSESGRGLFLISAFARDVTSTTRLEGGTDVCVVLPFSRTEHT